MAARLEAVMGLSDEHTTNDRSACAKPAHDSKLSAEH
jgi:hypothetical protein